MADVGQNLDFQIGNLRVLRALPYKDRTRMTESVAEEGYLVSCSRLDPGPPDVLLITATQLFPPPGPHSPSSSSQKGGESGTSIPQEALTR